MEQVIRFIDRDEFTGPELNCNRRMIAQFYLSGHGIEIGALHQPLQVPLHRCHVQYADHSDHAENCARYPELPPSTIVPTNIIDNVLVLDTLPNQSQDFIIASHTLAHSPDPYGTLLNWVNKLKPGGVIYAAIPITSTGYDKGRPVTSLQHLVDDHDFFSSIDKNAILDVTRDHLREYLEQEPGTQKSLMELGNNLMSGLVQAFQTAKRYAELIDAHVHYINDQLHHFQYHRFTPRSYETFLRYFTDQTRTALENVIKNGSNECIGIIRKQ